MAVAVPGEFINLAQEVPALLREAIAKKHRYSVVHAEDPHRSSEDDDVENCLSRKAGCSPGIAHEAVRSEAAARDRHATRVGDTRLAFVIGCPAGRDLLGWDNLDDVEPADDGNGRLVGVAGQVCDRRHDQILRSGDADDDASGDSDIRRGRAKNVAAFPKRKCLKGAALLRNIGLPAGKRDLRRRSVCLEQRLAARGGALTTCGRTGSACRSAHRRPCLPQGSRK